MSLEVMLARWNLLEVGYFFRIVLSRKLTQTQQKNLRA